MTPTATPSALSASPPCGPLAEAMLNLYADGELEPEREPALEAHLAACAACRAQLDALLAFRRALREEPLAVPASIDAAILARATATRRRPAPYTAARRAEDRYPLTALRRRRKGNGWIAVGVLLAVAFGTWLAQPAPEAAAPIVQQRQEAPTLEAEPVFVIYPGLTVEEDRATPER